MKKIEVIIKPSKLVELKAALAEVGIEEVTVTEVKGFGRQKAHPEIFRGSEYLVEFVAETKVELLVAEPQLHGVMAAIRAATLDGKVMVCTLDVVPSFRTQRMGELVH